MRDKQANIAQAMLRYVYQLDEVDTVMTAMNNIEEVALNLEATFNPAISPYEKSMLDRLSENAAKTKRKFLEARYQWLEN